MALLEQLKVMYPHIQSQVVVGGLMVLLLQILLLGVLVLWVEPTGVVGVVGQQKIIQMVG